MNPEPTEIRDANWEALRERVTGLRLAVLDAWRMWGPGTTRAVAGVAGIDLLTFRPRTTELLDLCLIECVGREDGEGVYRARTDVDAKREWERAQRRETQPALL